MDVLKINDDDELVLKPFLIILKFVCCRNSDQLILVSYYWGNICKYFLTAYYIMCSLFVL